MTKEQFNEACNQVDKIRSLERLCKYDHINANGYFDGPVGLGLFTMEEFSTIINEANEKVRERARKALAIAQREFDAL